MADFYQDFPYEEVKTPNGDFFDRPSQLLELGFSMSQVWSVCESIGDDGITTHTYGPAHHYVNRLGYVGTYEKHDFNTYYHEEFSIP